ncbi:TetR/AcrR family transcriptional regulator [Pseudalkalibacillus berkeleyi]|uniref:TetR/AcrR family transcriptional regulator n=1 Tax=Pseudalkalibacillus berkeleyi TaxID=1069813 RepID=A0ABS9GXR3_9BACL|nr:TetR/AcrR family transcriptional regulator [Pseudalkalibacillus berkeleyi]MCF6136485.1 TetR/AcrR family transcriptional regulator [Pseudalkalibacillus berkeleyi]
MVNGFEKRAQKIKEKLIHTTLDLLSMMEPRNIRISDIANQANVSQVTIYNHFGSKEDLIKESLKTFYLQSINEFEVLIKDKDRSFQETIELMMFYKKETIQKYSTSKLQEYLLQDPEVKNFVEEIYTNRTLPLMIELIDNAKEKGEIQRDIPHSLIMFYLDIFKEKAEEFANLSKTYESEEKFVEDMMNLFFYGVAGKG